MVPRDEGNVSDNGRLKRRNLRNHYGSQNRIAEVDDMTNSYLERARLKSSTEASIMAAQEQVLSISTTEAQIYYSRQYLRCRLWEEAPEIIQHLTAHMSLLEDLSLRWRDHPMRNRFLSFNSHFITYIFTHASPYSTMVMRYLVRAPGWYWSFWMAINGYWGYLYKVSAWVGGGAFDPLGPGFALWSLIRPDITDESIITNLLIEPLCNPVMICVDWIFVMI